MSLNLPTLLIFNTMQCQAVLHFRNPTTSCSNSYPWIVHTSDIVLHPHCWCPILLCTLHRGTCFLLGGNRTRLYSSEVGDMTTLGFDGDVPSATCCRRSSFEDPRGQLIFLLQAMGKSCKIKVHTLHLKGSFKFWIAWVSSAMFNLTIQLNLILDGVIRDICISLRWPFSTYWLHQHATNLSQAA